MSLQTRIPLLIIGLILLRSVTFGQINFNDGYLKLQEQIAYSTNFSNIVEYMKQKDYKLDDKGKSEGNHYFIFKGTYSQLVIAIYSTKKELLLIKSNLLSLNVVFCEQELEKNKFKKNKVSNEQEGDAKWVEITWGKSGYPYQYKLDHVSDKITWLYLITPDFKL